MPDLPIQPHTAALTDMLRQIALDIADAQRALDQHAEAALQQAQQNDEALPVVAFHFPQIEVDLQLAFTFTRSANRNILSVTPANPTSGGFFQRTSFSSRIRASIAPRAVLVAEPPTEEPQP
jgi:hypothetical protein